MKIKKFTEFITEGDDENIPDNKQTNKKLKDKVNKDVSELSDDCPRCGEGLDSCACAEEDWASTRNMHLIKPGKKKSQTAKNK